MTRRRVVVLGSTGSIGTQTLDVCRAAPERFDVAGLGVHSNVKALCAQAAEFRPQAVCVVAGEVPGVGDLPAGTRVLTGEDGLEVLAAGGDADVVVNAVVGSAGLRATVAALGAGRDLALANKETLVAGGPLVLAARDAGGGRILPVDSEHAASAQLLAGEDPGAVGRLVLTASGGPFRGRRRQDLAAVTVEEALRHPTWRMGAKITVDSATLMNKGLEVIEAHFLFGLEFDRIGVVVHPQSVVHAILELRDGSSKAQLALADMRQPIGWALAWPERLDVPYGAVEWTALPPLTFEAPDEEAFPAVGLAYAAGRAGGTAPATLNAANEEAVGAFLAGRCGFLDIPRVVEAVVAGHSRREPGSVDDVVDVDAEARARARELLAEG